VHRDYSPPSAVALHQRRCALRVLVSRPQWLYFNYAAHPGASTPRVARRRLLHLCHASGCLGTSRGSSSTTSPTPRVWVPRHVARLVVDYFAYAARPGASARHAARCRLLRPRCATGCLGTSRGSSRCPSSTTSRTPRVRVPRHVARLVVDYFTYAARLGASALRAAHHAARHVACRVAHHATRRRLLRLRLATEYLGTSLGSSRGSSSTTSPTPRDRVPRHLTRLITQLVVNYFSYAARPGASARRAARLSARRRLLCLRRASGCLGTSRDSSCGSSTTTLCVATSSCGHTGSTSATPCVATTCLVATLALLRVRHAPPRHRLPVTSH
jgi:hypothetical protein